jgi:cell division protein FtsB
LGRELYNVLKPMKQKLEQLAQRLAADIQHFSDPRFVGQIVFVVIVLLVSWSGIKSIQSNYGLQQQITALKQQNDLQQLKNANSKLQNDYYNSKQYLELSARQNFGLAVSGEKEVIVPESVAASYVSGLQDVKPATVAVARANIKQSNVQAWINFFLHRNFN